MPDHPLPGAGFRPEWTEPELERALRDLGGSIAYPPTPDLAGAVRRRLALEPARPPRSGWRDLLGRAIAARLAGLTPRRAVAVAVLAVALAGAALLALVPTARETVAGWLGVGGVRIVFVDETPTPAAPAASPTPAPLGSSLLLGERVTLADAQARVRFPLRLPNPDRFGPPDEVYVRVLADGAMVSFLYYPRPGLPAAAETGVGLLLVQFAAPEDSFWIEKGITVANQPRVVRVGDGEGLWLGGAHYLMIAPDPALGVDAPSGRTAANVLLWDEDGVTYRLESGLAAPEAIALAGALAPAATPAP